MPAACLANFLGKSFSIFAQPYSSLDLCSLPFSTVFQLRWKLLCKKSLFPFVVQVENEYSGQKTELCDISYFIGVQQNHPEGLLKLRLLCSTPKSFWSSGPGAELINLHL